jgi:hypothetical protein
MDGRVFVTGLAMALTLSAQTFQRRANMVGGGTRDQGRCSLEVTVDAVAQVEIRGDNATLRNLQGQPPQWRRFECTAPLPPNPINLQLSPQAGRGREFMVSEPRNGNGAVIQIEDPQDGPGVYAFDLYWGERGGPATGFNERRDDRRDDRSFRNDQPFEGPGVPDRGPGRRFTENEAVQVCQDSIRDQAIRRFGTQNIDLRRTSLDDNPGRRDWVNGELVVRGRFGRQYFYRFACSVDFDRGQVRSARIDQFESQYYPTR